MARTWLLIVASSLLLPLGPAGAEVRDNSDLNYSLEIPNGWVWDTAKPSWEKDKIVDGARRVLEKLEGGKAAQGQAGQVHLSVMDAPAGKTLAELAADPAQREFVLRFFAGAATPPPVEVEETIIRGENGTAPAARLVMRGASLNLQGVDGPCRALLVLVLARGKLYRLRLVAWTTEHDDEGLGSDLDAIDSNFQIPNLEELKPKPSAGPGAPDHPPGPDAEPGGPPPSEEPDAGPQGDEAEEKAIELKEFQFKFVKPKKLKTSEIDAKKYPNTVVLLESNDRDGSCQVMLSVYENGKVVNGVVQGNQDIQKWMTTSWWQWLTAALPAGELLTYAWPKNRNTATFLTLPLWDKSLVLAETPKKRPPNPGSTEIIKKMRMVEQAEGKLGDIKPIQAYRGAVKGNRERVGNEQTLRFAWTTVKWTYMLSVVFGRDGLVKYGPPVKQFLESIELLK